MKIIGQDEIVRAYVAKANIDCFRRMLKTETDPTKRGVISELLAAEEKRQTARGDEDPVAERGDVTEAANVRR